MKIQPGATKRSVILFWCLAVSSFLYFFSASMEEEISFLQFFNFSILLFGGGVAYHVTTLLASCPQNKSNYKQWSAILFHLLKIFAGYIIAGVSLFGAIKLGGDWGWLLAFLGLIFGYFWVMHYLFELQKPITKLLESDEKFNENEKNLTSAC